MRILHCLLKDLATTIKEALDRIPLRLQTKLQNQITQTRKQLDKRRSTMTLDTSTVRKISNLARLNVDEDSVLGIANELNAILDFVETLENVQTDNVPPLTSVIGQTQTMRSDEVTAGSQPEDVLANAPDRVADFYAVPKVVE